MLHHVLFLSNRGQPLIKFISQDAYVAPEFNLEWAENNVLGLGKKGFLISELISFFFKKKKFFYLSPEPASSLGTIHQDKLELT